MSTALTERRAGMVVGILQHVMSARSPVSYDEVFRRALAATGLPEEEVGEDIRDATSCLVYSGALLSNGFDRERAEISYSAAMEILPGPWLFGFVWREHLAEHDGGAS